MPSFYQRPLPGPAVPFSSDEGRALFREALAEGHMEGFFAVAEQFHTQAEPAFCGLGSLVVVLNALAIDPGRLWKGPWRWFSEELLDCCAPLEDVRAKGLTIDELACLSRCNGAEVRVERASDADVAKLRADIHEAARAPRSPVMVASYSRSSLGQTGEGHFSPIGGFHAARDLVLLLDVARFKYPPHWVPVAQLHEAMMPVDPASGRSRGWLSFRARKTPQSALHALSGGAHVGELFAASRDAVVAALRADGRDARTALASFAHAVEPVARALEVRVHRGEEGQAAAARARAALRATEVHAMIEAALGSDAAEGAADARTALAVAVPSATWDVLAEPTRRAVLLAIDRARAIPEVDAETATLREQLAALARFSACRAEA